MILHRRDVAPWRRYTLPCGATWFPNPGRFGALEGFVSDGRYLVLGPQGSLAVRAP